MIQSRSHADPVGNRCVTCPLVMTFLDGTTMSLKPRVGDAFKDSRGDYSEVCRGHTTDSSLNTLARSALLVQANVPDLSNPR